MIIISLIYTYKDKKSYPHRQISRNRYRNRLQGGETKRWHSFSVRGGESLYHDVPILRLFAHWYVHIYRQILDVSIKRKQLLLLYRKILNAPFIPISSCIVSQKKKRIFACQCAISLFDFKKIWTARKRKSLTTKRKKKKIQLRRF